MPYLALSPVATAVYTALNVAGLTALATGGVHDTVSQPPPLPCVLVEVDERDVRGFGTGGLPEVRIRVHAFTDRGTTAAGGMKQAQQIIAKVIELLRDQSLTVTGYTQAGAVFYDDTVLVGDEIVNGVLVHELVANFRIYVEE